MAKPRKTSFETPTARLRLPIQKKPHWQRLGPGLSLGYRRNEGAGSWSVRASNGRGGEWLKKIGYADDFEPANGALIMTHAQAMEMARKLVRGTDEVGDQSRPVTLDEALKAYERDLEARGGATYNARAPRRRLTAALLARPLTLLTSSELRKWRDELLAVMKPASAHRLLVCIRAACNLAANADPQRIRSRAPWTIGLASPPRPGNPRNVVLNDLDVSRFVAAAYERDKALGLFVDVMSVIGSRPSQLARLTVADLLAHRTSPKLMVPKSAKGKHGATKKHERTSVPVTCALAARLKAAAHGRAANEPLLAQADGSSWGKRPSLAYDTAVTEIVAALKLGKGTTLYTLRHSSITRALLRGVPIALVAKLHDTSVYQIEKTYAAHISRHGDEVARMALLHHDTPDDGGNVVPLAS
jgi:hypothetical protein